MGDGVVHAQTHLRLLVGEAIFKISQIASETHFRTFDELVRVKCVKSHCAIQHVKEKDMFRSLRVGIVYFISGVVRVPIKIRDTFYGAEYTCK